MKRLGLVVLATLVAILLGAAPSVAMVTTIRDSGGDAPAQTLDVKWVRLDNGFGRVKVKVHLRTMNPGAVVVSVEPSHGRGVRMLSVRDQAGHTTDYVADGAFGDPHPSSEPIRCRGLRVRWYPEEPSVTFKMPSECLNDGHYRALRFQVLTEDEEGGDADQAPDDGPTRWLRHS